MVTDVREDEVRGRVRETGLWKARGK